MANMASFRDSVGYDSSPSTIFVAQLEKLPVELLVKILSYLDTRRDLVTCCKVSKAFDDAATSPSLWKALCAKVWRLFECQSEDWKKCYADMYCDWGRYEQCYADIRMAWDRIESFTKKYCPAILQGLSPGASENDLNKAELQNLNGRYLPDDYRCFLRIHNGQTDPRQPSVMGSTRIANHHKKEALLSCQISSSGVSHGRNALQGCIPITLCVSTTSRHYMALSEEAGHKRGRIVWPSIDNDTVNLSGDGKVHFFLVADNFTQWITSYSKDLIKEEYPVINGEIYAYKFASEETSATNGIVIRTATCFLPELSNVNPPKFFFTYRITISMDSSVPKECRCKLETRHWFITDGNGQKEEVHGAAVVGSYPTMVPGAKFEYVSCTSFTTPTGTMEGHYTFKYLYKEGTTNARIAPMHFKALPFELSSERLRRCHSEQYLSESESD